MRIIQKMIERKGGLSSNLFLVSLLGMLCNCAPRLSPGITFIEGKNTGQILYIVEQDSLLGILRKITYDGNLLAPSLTLSHSGRTIKKCDDTEWTERWVVSSGAPEHVFGDHSMFINKEIYSKHAITCTLSQAYDTLDIQVVDPQEVI